MILVRALLALIMLSAFSAPAMAQDITGGWSFKTVIKEKGCQIEGNMSVYEDRDTGALACEFTSRETCDWDAETDEGTVIDQACRIYEQGDYYLFSSRVVQSLTLGYDPAGYLPDNFVVKPDGPERMSGHWYDRNYRDTVEFWRNRNTEIS